MAPPNTQIPLGISREAVDFLVTAREQAKTTDLLPRARAITRFLKSQRVKLYDGHGTWQMTVNGKFEQGYIVDPSLRIASVASYNPYAGDGGVPDPGPARPLSANLNASASAWHPPGGEVEGTFTEVLSLPPSLPSAAQPSGMCAFFMSDQGCRYGARCKNVHDEDSRRDTLNAVRGREVLRAKRGLTKHSPMPPPIHCPVGYSKPSSSSTYWLTPPAEEDEDAHAASVAAALARSGPMQQSRDLDPAMVGMGATGDHWGMVEEFEHRTVNRTLGVQDNQAGEITTLVYSREIARYKRNFKEAGKLKKRLKELGVRVDDKEKMWHSSDGTSGFVPPYALLQLGDDHFNPYY
jgi:hypothetical protein